MIVSETFDSGLGMWNVLRSHFSTANDYPRGNGDGGRGAMFRAAPGANDLSFTFFRTGNANTQQKFGDLIEIGPKQDQVLDPTYDTISATSNSVVFAYDARSNVLSDHARFAIYDGTGNSIALWSTQSPVLDNTWYYGFIRLLPTQEAVFGYRISGAQGFTASPSFSLPSGFVSSYVGVTAYRVPAINGASGETRLDNIVASIVPEPASAVFAAVICVTLLARSRFRFKMPRRQF